jgi:hypothetical protein
MKHCSSKISLLLLLAMALHVKQLSAQAKLHISRLGFKNFQTYSGTVDSMYLTLKNIGTLAVSSPVYIYYQTDGMPQKVTLDSINLNGAAPFQPNDTIPRNYPKFLIQQNNFHRYTNIVVVWPSATGIANDSSQTSVYVFDPNGIMEVQSAENGFALYPNPSNTCIYLWAIDPKNSIENVRIFNNMGALVKSISGDNNRIDVNGMNSGIYFIEIETSTGKRITKRFVREQ